MRHEFHPDALAEYEEAACYYGGRHDRLGHCFIDEVEFTIRQILEEPLRWRVFEEDIRRCLTSRFPYAILYTVEPDYVLIIAVMHCRREPGYWHHRLKR